MVQYFEAERENFRHFKCGRTDLYNHVVLIQAMVLVIKKKNKLRKLQIILIKNYWIFLILLNSIELSDKIIIFTNIYFKRLNLFWKMWIFLQVWMDYFKILELLWLLDIWLKNYKILTFLLKIARKSWRYSINSFILTTVEKKTLFKRLLTKIYVK